jgi:hypothetical protein
MNGHYTRYPLPKQTQQLDTFDEMVEDRMDGYVTFKFEGIKYQLDATETNSGKLFIKFKDLTSSRETYPPSRYYYTEPVKNGKVVIYRIRDLYFCSAAKQSALPRGSRRDLSGMIFLTPGFLKGSSTVTKL